MNVTEKGHESKHINTSGFAAVRVVISLCITPFLFLFQLPLGALWINFDRGVFSAPVPVREKRGPGTLLRTGVVTSSSHTL